MICNYTSFSTVFQPYQHDGRESWKAVCNGTPFHFEHKACSLLQYIFISYCIMKCHFPKSIRKSFLPIFLSNFYINPAGTWRTNDIVLTSMRRDYDASASIRRHFVTKGPLGSHHKTPRWRRIVSTVENCNTKLNEIEKALWSFWYQ